MPFIRVDAEAFDEIVSEVDAEDLPPGFAENRPSGDFQYEASTARFQPSELSPVAQVALESLLASGATHFRVRYDGGYDEGFSYPEYVIIGERHRPATEVADELAKTAFVSRVRSAAADRRYESYAKLEDKLVGRYAIDELAHALASRLLGDGYGTGEYELYGAFTADLRSGEIKDDPAAQKPDSIK